MSTTQEKVTRDEIHSCPCCGKEFFAKVTYGADGMEPLEAFRLRLCADCKKPCCPYCAYLGGERVICTRCTTYPNCRHAHMGPEQMLYQRLVRQKTSVHRIEIGWNASDGGSFGGIKLLGATGDKLDEWQNWAILSSGGRSGVEIMEEVICAALSPRAIRDREVRTYYANFEVR